MAGLVPLAQGQGQGRGLSTLKMTAVRNKKITAISPIMFKISYIDYVLGQIDCLNTLTLTQVKFYYDLSDKQI